MRKTGAPSQSATAPPPDAGALRAAALAHLARFAATEAGLARVLQRKIDNWGRKSGADRDAVALQMKNARACIPKIIGDLVAAGAVSDAGFAASRALSLVRAGRSRRAIGAHLITRGVPAELASSVLPPDPSHELAAALIHARKRRLGPWRKAAASPELLRRELGSFARAGFAQSVASQALRYGRDEAEAMIAAFRTEL
jgi:regulatory protein